MKVGDIIIEAVSDGHVLAPASAIFRRPMEDWIPHEQFLDGAGNITMSMGGFLVRSGDLCLMEVAWWLSVTRSGTRISFAA